MNNNNMPQLFFAGFLYFWGWVFIITTSFIALFKYENTRIDTKDVQVDMDIRQAYKLLWTIVKLPSMKTMIIFLLTAKVRSKNLNDE